MKWSLKPILFLLLLLPWGASAEFTGSQVIVGLGMVNNSFAESASTLKSTSGKTRSAASGSVTGSSGYIEYEKFINSQWSFGNKGYFPLIGNPSGSYLSYGLALNRYFNSLSSGSTVLSKDLTLVIKPKWRFHVGGGVGAAYLSYTTESAKKSDTQAEVFGQAGGTYEGHEGWGYRGEFGIARAIGVSTTSMTMRILFGVTYAL